MIPLILFTVCPRCGGYKGMFDAVCDRCREEEERKRDE